MALPLTRRRFLKFGVAGALALSLAPWIDGRASSGSLATLDNGDRALVRALAQALLAGALLAFALSFDEIIVTIFTAGGVQTLPIWIFQSFRLANQVPLVNVAGLIAILLSVIPVYIASRITQGEVAGRV